MASKNASASSPVSVRNAVGERWRRQRAGGDDDAVPILGRQSGDFLAADVDQRMFFQRGGDGAGKAVAVDCKRAARRHLVGVGRAQHQRAEPAQLRMQEANGVGVLVVGAQRIGAHQFRKVAGLDARQSFDAGAFHG